MGLARRQPLPIAKKEGCAYAAYTFITPCWTGGFPSTTVAAIAWQAVADFAAEFFPALSHSALSASPVANTIATTSAAAKTADTVGLYW
jgi:hypothetical protein